MTLKKFTCAMAAMTAALACGLPSRALADDIDIFTGASAGGAINPRILVVLDNTSNWSRQSQQWPGGLAQGQSEVRALKSALSRVGDTTSIGLMEFVTKGSSSYQGGFMRFGVKPMTIDNKAALSAELDEIFNDINGKEKRSSSAAYGFLMFDIYNYFAGRPASSPNDTTDPLLADATAYASPYWYFKSPLTSDTACGRIFVIFIGNPNASGPDADTSTNGDKLTALGGSMSQLELPNFVSTTVQVPTPVGVTAQCYADAEAAKAGIPAFATQCSAYSLGCSIGASISPAPSSCQAGTTTWNVIGTNEEVTNVATTGSTLDTKTMNSDEWARFLHDKGVPIPNTTIRPSVTTYTIDVYNKQPNATHTSLLLSMAKAGGGKYFAAQSEQGIVNALEQILGEIMSVNSSFASTSLPVNATNRSQNENQVFIGMFRPDPNANPRWFGNLKRYQLVAQGNNIELGDVNGNLAINTLTGFLTPCANSYWTTDSGDYWNDLNITPDPAGTCDTKRAYSDAPDGPLVEKGAVGQVIRNGNNPPLTTSAPTFDINRNMYTRVGNALATFDTTNTGLSADVVNFIRGQDVNNEKGDGLLTKARPSLHGDVIHSRPLPINYGGSTGVVVFYGANDGTFRAVEANSGKEYWSFVAPEFNARLERLKTGYPTVAYPTSSGPSTSATAMPKDYFFDGSTGVYQNADGTKVWVFPSMRRGGRMIYALDVSTPTAPRLLWSAGCPNLTNDTGCTPGMSQMGQSWSTPSVAFIKGYSETEPVLLFGGGYDKCEDDNLVAPYCSTTKGNVVYVLKASTGELLASFPTARGVAADIALADIDNDAMPDYAYAADIGGSIYRINFIDGPNTRNAQPVSQWQQYKVAYTSGGGRKFLFAPALLPVKTKVYLAIGSGDREHPLGWQYPYASAVVNRFYVRLDDLTVSDSSLAQNLDGMTNFTTATTCSTPGVLPSSTMPGWYINLVRGEQTVTSALIAGGMVTFSTNRPLVGTSATCSAALGVASGYWLNLFNASGGIGVEGICGGERSTTFIGGGLPPSPVLATGVPVGNRAVSVVIGAVQRQGGASVAIAPQRMPPLINSKRKRVYSYTKGQ